MMGCQQQLESKCPICLNWTGEGIDSLYLVVVLFEPILATKLVSDTCNVLSLPHSLEKNNPMKNLVL